MIMENEFFAQVKQEAETYGKALGNVGRLHLIGLVSRVLGLFLLIFTIVLCVFALLAVGTVVAISALAAYMPVWAAALIIGGVYILLIILAVVCRKQLFIHPFIALLSKQVIGTQDELNLETLKAEHEVALQTIRLETQVENATRELNFYATLLNRVWNWLRAKL